MILLYDAIYYLDHPDRFLKECRRVLRDCGTVLICTVNREWSDFNPSPFSKRYFSAKELDALLANQGFQPEILGGFPVSHRSLRDSVVSLIKRVAVALHLVPKTMKGKQLLKRLFLGKLAPLPNEVTEDTGDYLPPSALPSHCPIPDFKVLYAVGRTAGSPAR